MTRSAVMLGLAGALATCILALPATANASCAGRRMTGTVLGGIGGALIGNSISRGGGGALIGGLGGAVVGHEVAGAGCGGYRSRYYGPRYRSDAAQPRAVRYVYYDQYGDPVSAAPAPAYPTGPYGYGGCRAETQSYYDDRGALVRRQVQVCAR